MEHRRVSVTPGGRRCGTPPIALPLQRPKLRWSPASRIPARYLAAVTRLGAPAGGGPVARALATQGAGPGTIATVRGLLKAGNGLGLLNLQVPPDPIQDMRRDQGRDACFRSNGADGPCVYPLS